MVFNIEVEVLQAQTILLDGARVVSQVEGKEINVGKILVWPSRISKGYLT